VLALAASSTRVGFLGLLPGMSLLVMSMSVKLVAPDSIRLALQVDMKNYSARDKAVKKLFL